jgi:biopolymer transport protein TolR
MKRRLHHEMNVVPYIDVMLVLLIIFMVTAPLLTQGVAVELPQTQANTIATDQNPLLLSVDAQGRYSLEQGKSRLQALDEFELAQHLPDFLQKDSQVLLRADKRVDYGRVALAMSILQQAGASQIGFVTEPRP